MSEIAPHHIIAIGASAGGMEEINTFFDHTPLDGVAYVIIQHLSSDFKSRMAELLSKHSKLEVIEAIDGNAVKSNKVYLIPHNKFMTISEDRLHLTDKKDVEAPHLTINAFFNSLAKDCGKKAIAIVLSGLGSDGSQGIRAIKKAGGLVMVSNPETTEFNSMPSNAVATGLVDFILDPEFMPQAIEDYVKYGGEMLVDGQVEDKNLTAIVNHIAKHSSHDFSDYKRTTILRRTKRRAAFHNFTNLGSYLDFLKATPDETEELAKEFLISVTSFFRDKEPFEFIQNKIIPDILSNLQPDEELKMWVAGCASGEEVYSMAILIAEQLKGDFKDLIVKIFATDIDRDALTYAGMGVYTAHMVKNVSAQRLAHYFSKEGNNYKVSPIIRKMVIFAQHDLVKNPPYCNMHFISCRNLLIYMTPVLQKKIFDMFLFGLKISGYLFLGSSENPAPILNNLEVVNKKWKIYKNLETKRSVSFDAFSMPELPEIKRAFPTFPTKEASKIVQPILIDAIQLSLARELDYLMVCIDEEMQVVQSYGDTKYLLQKHFTSNLTELLPKPLIVAFSTLLKTSIKTNKKKAVKGIKITKGRLILSVNLSIIPLTLKKGNERFYLVVFSENDILSPEHNHDKMFDAKTYQDEYVMNLEEELLELKEKLSSAYEHLAASNENLQSFNEELLSANEEMQSTNEEMQSVNEELHTINYDYQSKNKELLEINDDLNNYFRSNINGQLFIDKHLRLMKFSPGTVKQINLVDSDIGRPLSNITTNIKFETIIEDIKIVLAEGSTINKEIETNNGKWYQIRTMPYVQQTDNNNNGAIITFNDITELKVVQQELKNSNKLLNMATDSARMGTWSIDVNTREFISSAHLKHIFGVEADQELTYEGTIAQIVDEHRSQVLAAVDATMNRGEEFDLEYSIQRQDGRICWISAIGNLTYNQDGKPTYFTGLLHDITEHKMDDLRKNDFIAMVSHELKTPITSLQAYLQILSKKAITADDTFATDALKKAELQVKKMTALINGFLDLSRLESGKIQLDRRNFAIDILLTEIVEEASKITQNHTIILHACPPLEVNADREKIGQVISNFLSNSIKYSSPGKNIEVFCKEYSGMLQVSVKDEGAGIRIEDQGKLFDRYHRVENMPNKSISGFGLGLYLSAEIIRRHQGEIWMESELDKGSVFHFNLPMM
ncbi:MAG: chemotaxis protein CheB [Daejeonella sp.]